MKLVYFSDEAYRSLKKDISNNVDYYGTEEDWLNDYFIRANIADPIKTSSIEVPDLTLDYHGNKDQEIRNDDLVNSIALYENYKNLITPRLATDPRFWTALCHLTFSKYVTDRWQINAPVKSKKADPKDSKKDKVQKRYFVTNGRSTLYYYNAIARLWWSGYLTYDASNKNDPYHLTKILFSAQQVQKDLFDQPMSTNKDICKGILYALDRIQQKTGNAASDPFRKCCDSYLNHYGAVTILDSLPVDKIENIAYNYMLQFVK